MSSFKLLHSSDWHLGKSLFAKSLLEDQKLALAELTQIIARERPDVILLAGDLFDRSVPPEDAVKELDRFLAKVVLDLNVPVALIPGNHDSNTRVGVGADLLRASGLHVFSTPESIASPFQMESAGIKTSIYGVPYLEPAEWNFFFESTAKNADEAKAAARPIRTHAEALEAILKFLEPSLAQARKENRRTILMLHAYVTGGEPSESERPLSIGGSDLVPAELLAGFDYVALGHLHRPQKVSSERIRYPGSLFPYSQSEADQEKGVVLASLGATSDADSFKFCAFKTSKKLRVIRGTLEELISNAPLSTASTDNQSYFIAVLTDHSLPFEAYRRLQAVYDGLLHVSREIDWTRSEAEQADLSARNLKREMSDRDVLAQFISNAASQDVSDEDREWLLAELESFSKTEDSQEAGSQ